MPFIIPLLHVLFESTFTAFCDFVCVPSVVPGTRGTVCKSSNGIGDRRSSVERVRLAGVPCTFCAPSLSGRLEFGVGVCLSRRRDRRTRRAGGGVILVKPSL